MKNASYFSLSLFILSFTGLTGTYVFPDTSIDDVFAWGTGAFNANDAEKILGEPATLTESDTLAENGIWTYKCAYKARQADEATGKTGSIYYMQEQYPTIATAREAYAAIKRANEGHEGIEILHHLGDEAYFHSDGQNFYFILARVGTKMFRMKVNKTTRHTSEERFRQVAEEIAQSL